LVTENFNIDDHFKTKAIYWASKQHIAIALNNNTQNYPLGGFPNCIGVVNKNDKIITEISDIQPNTDYMGWVGYDFKNQLEELTSKNSIITNFPNFLFFEPTIKLSFNENSVTITSSKPNYIYQEINNLDLRIYITTSAIVPKPITSKEAYLNQIKGIQTDINKGNIYEVNHCVSYISEETEFDCAGTYIKLCRLSPTPFSCFVKYNDSYILCASPERYFKLENNKIISQPIKGTKRVLEHSVESDAMQDLHNSEKERNENVMIVDLVRNDLSKVCKAGTVKVDELFGIYKFTNLYQMISTISGILEANNTVIDVLKHTFPMGSMTGAPKLKALQLIEQNEDFRRNIYSGTVGYINANGDADFNVVIRSIFYDQKKVSFAVGSGITALSDMEQEYEECLLKAEKMVNVLANGT
jgi:para-aminobenzoate synthetase component I